MSINLNKELLFLIISEQINNNCSLICKIINDNQNINKDKLIKLVNNKINHSNFESEILKLKNQKFINYQNDIFSLNENNILQVIKYPKYCFLINMIFGEKGNIILENFMEFGIGNFNSLIIKLELKQINDIEKYLKYFILFIEKDYLIEEKQNFLTQKIEINNDIKNYLIQFKEIVK
jgi:hypothetical protein